MIDQDTLRARHEQLQALEHEQRVAAQQLADRLAETRGRRLEVEDLLKSILADEAEAAARASQAKALAVNPLKPPDLDLKTAAD